MKTKINKYKIIFFGTPEFSIPSFLFLLKNNFFLPFIITQPDKPKGRGKKISSSPIKIIAKKNKLKVIQPEKLDKETIEKIKNEEPDFILVVAYGKFLPAEILNIPKYGVLNIHPSLLPKYRGPSPIQYTLLNGDKKTGVSLMKLDKQMDHGPIIAQQEINIEENDDFISLNEKLSLLSAKLLEDKLLDYLSNKITLREQNHKMATFSKLINKQDAEINFNDSTKNIINKIKAFTAWPVVKFEYQNQKIKIYSAEAINFKIDSGKILINKKKKQILIGTKDGAINILELQLPGRKKISVKDYINGLK